MPSFYGDPTTHLTSADTPSAGGEQTDTAPAGSTADTPRPPLVDIDSVAALGLHQRHDTRGTLATVNGEHRAFSPVGVRS